MAKKPTLPNLTGSHASSTQLNRSFRDIEDAFQNTLSLDGSTPNSMGADLDMNSNDILNVGTIFVDEIKVDGVALGLSEAVADAAQAAIEAGQARDEAVAAANSVTNNEAIPFNVVGDGFITTATVAGVFTSKNSFVDVSVGGVSSTPDDYTLTNDGVTTTLTFTEAFPEGAVVHGKALKQLSSEVTVENNITNLSTKSFANRAAVLTWIAINTPPIGAKLQWDGVAVRYTGSGSIISDMPGYVPDGVATILHYGGNVAASSATNLVAINAALAAHNDVVLPRVQGGTYAFSGQIRITGNNKTLRGDGPLRTGISFDDTFDGSCILFEPSNPLDTAYVGNNQIRNLSLTGNNSVRTTRIAISIRKQEQFQASNLRVGGFSFGIDIAGGQFVYVDNCYGFGSGQALGAELAGSYHIRVGQAATSGSPQVNYNTFINNFNVGGSSNKNIQDIIVLQQTDGLYITDGYIAYGARSLLRLEGLSGAAIGAVFVKGTYFDGVGTASGTPHIISAKDDAVVGNCTMTLTNCYMGNTTEEILDLGANNNLRDITFSGVQFNNSAVGIGKIKGQTSATDGLRLTFTGCSFGSAPLGLEIEGAQSVVVDGTFEDIDDATGALKLTGTIRQKRISANITNCVAGVSDTSTGESGRPDYEWIRNRVIGTVSFAGGLNTGDIFETVSNANGSAIKFADGTMICFHKASMGSITAFGAGTFADPYRTAGYTWSFPVIFTAVPVISATVHNPDTTGIRVACYVAPQTAPTTSVASFQAFRTTAAANADVMTGEFMAIGRWRT